MNLKKRGLATQKAGEKQPGSFNLKTAVGTPKNDEVFSVTTSYAIIGCHLESELRSS
jgi:hypothetical protein